MGELIIRRTALEYGAVEDRSQHLKFIQMYTSDFDTNNYPSVFQINYVFNTRTAVGYDYGDLQVPDKADGGNILYPIPLWDSTKITVTSPANYEIDMLKITDGVWKAYEYWGWYSSGTTVDVSKYAGQDYYIIVIVQSWSGSASNISIQFE